VKSKRKTARQLLDNELAKCPLCGWPAQTNRFPCALCSVRGVPKLPLFLRSISAKRTVGLQVLADVCRRWPVLLDDSSLTKDLSIIGGQWARTMLQPPPPEYVVPIPPREQRCEQPVRNRSNARRNALHAQLFTELFTAQGGLCTLCSQPLVRGAADVDHIVQMATHEGREAGAWVVLRRAAYYAKALHLVCQRCNWQKGVFEGRGGMRWAMVGRGHWEPVGAKPHGLPAELGWQLLQALTVRGVRGQCGRKLQPSEQARALKAFTLSIVSACPCRTHTLHARYDPDHRMLIVGCRECCAFSLPEAGL